MSIATIEKGEVFHRVLVDAMNEGAITLTQMGIVVLCNEYFLKMVKMPPEEAVESHWKRFFPVHEQLALERLLRKAKRVGSKGEFTLLASDGSTLAVEISIKAVHLD